MNNNTEPNPWKCSPQDNLELKAAFPSTVQSDALAAVSGLPPNPYHWSSFSVRTENESLFVPCRIYHDPSLIRTEGLSAVQEQMLACLLTRHHDGLIRQKYLTRIIAVDAAWLPPFVVQLVGEYVIEIIRVIEENLAFLDKSLYRQFLRLNPEFWTLTQQRVVSYWNCYYRSYRRDVYPGFQVLDFFRRLQQIDSD